MIYNISFSEDARQDLADIQDYLQERDTQAVIKIMAVLKNAAASLSALPHRYPKYKKGKPHFMMPVIGTAYLIFYRVSEEKQGIEIDHFWHGSRRSPRLK